MTAKGRYGDDVIIVLRSCSNCGLIQKLDNKVSDYESWGTITPLDYQGFIDSCNDSSKYEYIEGDLYKKGSDNHKGQIEILQKLSKTLHSSIGDKIRKENYRKYPEYTAGILGHITGIILTLVTSVTLLAMMSRLFTSDDAKCLIIVFGVFGSIGLTVIVNHCILGGHRLFKSN